MSAQALTYTDQIAEATAPIYEKLKSQYGQSHWETLAPYIYEINRLKKEKNAVILAHNYMTPDIFYGVGDITGDSLRLAQVAAETDADIIVQCGVHFMAETAKILSPEKKVLMPDLNAGCSLAESISGQALKEFKADYPGVPVVSYVNTTADVKAESDVCCTSSNAEQIIRALVDQGHKRIIMTPDKYLAQNVANAVPEAEIIIWDGSCIVHERFTVSDIENMRKTYGNDVVILAHPECPPEIIAQSDVFGSTAQINDYIKNNKPKRAVLLTECSMSDNIAKANPDIELVGTCQLCPHMKRISLPKILKTLQNEDPEIIVDPDIAAKAREAVNRMLELS